MEEIKGIEDLVEVLLRFGCISEKSAKEILLVTPKELYRHKYYLCDSPDLKNVANFIDRSPPPMYAVEYDGERFIVTNDLELMQALNKCETDMERYEHLKKTLRPQYVHMTFYLYKCIRRNELVKDEQAPGGSVDSLWLTNQFKWGRSVEFFPAQTNFVHGIYAMPELINTCSEILEMDTLECTSYLEGLTLGLMTVKTDTSSYALIAQSTDSKVFYSTDTQMIFNKDQYVDMLRYFNLPENEYEDSTAKGVGDDWGIWDKLVKVGSWVKIYNNDVDRVADVYETNVLMQNIESGQNSLHSLNELFRKYSDLISTGSKVVGASAAVVGLFSKVIGNPLEAISATLDFAFATKELIVKNMATRTTQRLGADLVLEQTIGQEVVNYVNVDVSGLQMIKRYIVNHSPDVVKKTFTWGKDVFVYTMSFLMEAIRLHVADDPERILLQDLFFSLVAFAAYKVFTANNYKIVQVKNNQYSFQKLNNEALKQWVLNFDQQNQEKRERIKKAFTVYHSQWFWDKLVKEFTYNGIAVQSHINRIVNDIIDTSYQTAYQIKTGAIKLNRTRKEKSSLQKFDFVGTLAIGSALNYATKPNEILWDYKSMYKNVDANEQPLYAYVYDLVMEKELKQFTVDDFKTLKLFDKKDHPMDWYGKDSSKIQEIQNNFPEIVLKKFKETYKGEELIQKINSTFGKNNLRTVINTVDINGAPIFTEEEKFKILNTWDI